MQTYKHVAVKLTHDSSCQKTLDHLQSFQLQKNDLCTEYLQRPNRFGHQATLGKPLGRCFQKLQQETVGRRLNDSRNYRFELDGHAPGKTQLAQGPQGHIGFSNLLKQVTPALKPEIALICKRLALALLQLCDKTSQGHSPEYMVEKTVPTG